MRRADALTPAQAQAAWLLRHWDRIGIGVRCAYNPFCACGLRAYLQVARQVIAAGARAEVQVHQRTLSVLLQTARDAALPWHWRSVCLDHAAMPLARLRTLLGPTDKVAVQAMFCAVQAATDELWATLPRAT
jgi:hypothetical protein